MMWRSRSPCKRTILSGEVVASASMAEVEVGERGKFRRREAKPCARFCPKKTVERRYS
jgi:hypothetical protein